VVTETSKIISKNIRMIRTDRDLNQATLAKRAKLSQSTIAQIERGVKLPSLGTLVQIAKALKVLPYQLLKEDYYRWAP
jgi:transcriptional regulator with XRE-family HTH domain